MRFRADPKGLTQSVELRNTYLAVFRSTACRRRLQHAAFAISATALLAGCDRIPGTDQYIISQGEKALAAHARDPASLQFRNAEIHQGTVCGEFNEKNLLGAYVGFMRFIAEPNHDKWYLSADVNYDSSAADYADKMCKSMQSNRYFAASSAMVCQAATQHQTNKIDHEGFEQSWKLQCK